MALERLSQREQDIFSGLEAEVARAQGDPEAASRALANVRGELARLRGVLGRPRPEAIYTVPFANPVTVANTGITPTPRTSFVFPKAGRVVGVKGMVREGMNLLSHVTVSIVDSGGYPFFRNGIAEAYVSLAMLCGNAYDQGGFLQLLFRRVQPNEPWGVTCSSGDALPAAGSTVYSPEIAFLLEHDEV